MKIWSCKLHFLYVLQRRKLRRRTQWFDQSLNKGVSHVTTSSEACFCSKGSSEGDKQPLPYLSQLVTITKTNIMMM